MKKSVEKIAAHSIAMLDDSPARKELDIVSAYLGLLLKRAIRHADRGNAEQTAAAGAAMRYVDEHLAEVRELWLAECRGAMLEGFEALRRKGDLESE